MFFRISVLSLSAVVLAFSSMVISIPLATRQIGDLQCNIDRLNIIIDLAKTISDVKSLSTAGANDPAVTAAATTAQGGLSTAEQGIATILGALFRGQTAPADARTQVEDGLATASNALSSINSTDPNVVSALGTAQTSLSNAGTAGDGVLANCN